MMEKQSQNYAEVIKSNRNWVADFKYENGKYMNRCMACDLYFLGYKRRMICYLCADHSDELKPDANVIT